MKINGRTLSSPNIEVLVIPRPDGDVVFKARGVVSFDQFNQLCPVPKPSFAMKPGGEQVPLLDDKTYKARLNTYGQQKTAWLIIESLKETPGLEWEMVKDNDPSTWLLWQEELRGSQLCESEIMQITNLVMSANSLDDSKLDLARKRFLASQGEQAAG